MRFSLQASYGETGVSRAFIVKFIMSELNCAKFIDSNENFLQPIEPFFMRASEKQTKLAALTISAAKHTTTTQQHY